MFEPFGFGQNEEAEGQNPRIIFAQLRRANRPILTEAGYRTFTATTFTAWAVVLILVWILRFEITVSADLIASIAGSSVELAALSLAVLGILLELNKKDRHFKIGLFLIAVLFAGVVLSGFYLSMTWQPAFDNPQQITIIFVAAIGLIWITQFDWMLVVQILRLRWWSVISFKYPARFVAFVKRTHLFIPFLIPLFVWIPNLNRLTGTILLFYGALIALVVLIGITTFELIRRSAEDEDVDPLVTQFQEQLQTIQKIDAGILEALSQLQNERLNEAKTKNEPNAALIEHDHHISRLRKLNIMNDVELIEQRRRNLAYDGKLFRANYTGPYWLIPDAQTTNQFINILDEFAIIYIEKVPKQEQKNSEFYLEDFKLTNLHDELVQKSYFPKSIIDDYLMPQVLLHLQTSDSSYSKKDNNKLLFVNRRWENSIENWDNKIRLAVKTAIESVEHWKRMFPGRLEPEVIESVQDMMILAAQIDFFDQLLGQLPSIIDVQSYFYDSFSDAVSHEHYQEILSLLKIPGSESLENIVLTIKNNHLLSTDVES